MTKSQLSYLTVKQNSNFIYSRTPRRYGRLSNTDSFQCPDKINFLKKKPPEYGLSLIRTTDTTFRPQRVNSYKLNFNYYGHCGDRVCVCKVRDFKSPIATICERCTEHAEERTKPAFLRLE